MTEHMLRWVSACSALRAVSSSSDSVAMLTKRFPACFPPTSAFPPLSGCRSLSGTPVENAFSRSRQLALTIPIRSWVPSLSQSYTAATTARSASPEHSFWPLSLKPFQTGESSFITTSVW